MPVKNHPMNLHHCEKFIRALRFGITRQHILMYREALQTAQADLPLSRNRRGHSAHRRNEESYELIHALSLLIDRRQPLALRALSLYLKRLSKAR